MEHFRAVFNMDLAEETRTQLQEEEALPPLATYWNIFVAYAPGMCCVISKRLIKRRYTRSVWRLQAQFVFAVD